MDDKMRRALEIAAARGEIRLVDSLEDFLEGNDDIATAGPPIEGLGRGVTINEDFVRLVLGVGEDEDISTVILLMDAWADYLMREGF